MMNKIFTHNVTPRDKQSPELTIEQVEWVFEMLLKNKQQGGSFRYLIYDLMGFSGAAYTPLYKAGGQEIVNMLHDAERKSV